MKISYNLLKQIVDFHWGADELADKLTMSGSEVEVIEHKGSDIKGIIAADVEKVEKVKGSDKLSLCDINDGSRKYRVICGAPNVAAGQVVLFAPVGSRIPGMTLKKAEIAGIESSGMILSEAELELSDNKDEIAVLDQGIKPGVPLEKIVGYKDTIFELEITPNRPDCLSHIGIAREIQALGGGKMKLPSTELSEPKIPASESVKIAIDDPNGCPRYTGRVIKNVKIAPSPLWMKMILYYLGMRPINNVVDITNYVMLELGHPLHAFDFDLFEKPEVLVRKAKNGEKFVTLDEIERRLNRDHLLITDSVKGVAIAGIMGGQYSEVSEKSGNILLESAYFDPVTIRRGSRALGLTTESSRRFERGADPEMAPVANDRAAKLISEITGGEILKGIVDAHPRPFVPVEIDLDPESANSLLGTELSAVEMLDLLNGLGIESKQNGNIVSIQPSFRPDLTRQIDLIEEIARIYGFDNIEPVFRPGGALGAVETKLQKVSGSLKHYLAGAGAFEVFPITLADSSLARKLGLYESSVRVMNPLSEEMAVVRPSLILTMLPVIRRNLNFREKDLLLFELGSVYLPDKPGKLPLQKNMLALAMAGGDSPVFWGSRRRDFDLFSMKGLIENIADYLKIGAVSVKPHDHFAFEQTCSFEVYTDGNCIGSMGKLSKKSCSIAEIKDELFLAELDLDKIVEITPDILTFRELDRFPSADRDMAVVVNESVKAGEIRDDIFKNSDGLAHEVIIFDLYRGKNIPEGKKSLAFGIKYRVPDRTLTDEEVDAVHSNIAENLKKRYGAELRK